MRQSIPRKVNQKSGVPEEERRVWGSQGGDRGLEFSRRRKRTNFFSTFLSLSKDYVTTMYLARGCFSLTRTFRLILLF